MFPARSSAVVPRPCLTLWKVACKGARGLFEPHHSSHLAQVPGLHVPIPGRGGEGESVFEFVFEGGSRERGAARGGVSGAAAFGLVRRDA